MDKQSNQSKPKKKITKTRPPPPLPSSSNPIDQFLFSKIKKKRKESNK
jgi:hypothetical protein